VLNANAVGALGSGALTMYGGTVGMNATNAYTGSADMTVGSLATLITTVKAARRLARRRSTTRHFYHRRRQRLDGRQHQQCGRAARRHVAIDQSSQTNGSSYDRWGDTAPYCAEQRHVRPARVAGGTAGAETVAVSVLPAAAASN